MAAKGSNTGRWLMGVLSVVIVAALILVAVPNMIRVTDCNNREAETKQNVHNIQLAIERYAVDHGGTYPLWLSGGSELRQEIRRMDTSVWVEGGELLDVVDFDPGPPSPDLLADPLMAEGYLPRYPRNPFTRGSSTVLEDQLRDLQEQLDDPLRPDNGSDFAPPALRFGRDYTLMGNVMADPRYAWMMDGLDSNGGPLMNRTGSDVIYRCWDIEELDEPQYWLQGQFLYKVPSGRTSFVNDISQFSFKSDVSGDYILGTYGSYRNKGKDILGDELPWQVIQNGNAKANLLWSFNGIEVPGKSYRQGSPYNWPVAGDYSGFPICYGNPNGQRDGLILVLTAEDPADMQFDYPDPQDINQKSEYSWD
ncbi:type II secretion system protein [bacterium]|nr:type II secretion system protein [bacterium]